MRHFARRFVLLASVSLLVAGCLSPTLPLPPPVAPEVEKIGPGQYMLHGEIPTRGFVNFLNKRTGQGVLALTDREYHVEISALPKDPMQVWYETDEEKSDVVPFEIPDDPEPPAGTGGGAN